MAVLPAENLGETLVPVVNRLQDIFGQVTARWRGIDWHWPSLLTGRVDRRSRSTSSLSCPRWLSSAARAAARAVFWRPWCVCVCLLR